mgnify:CR=1 FL=1
MSEISESKFNMWRASFSVVWIDGVLSDQEVDWINKKLSSLSFNQQQREIIQKDLEAQTPFNEIVPLVTHKPDRAFLAHQMRVISHLDGLDEIEKKAISNWKDAILKNIDLKKLEDEIAKDEMASYHEDEVFRVYNKSSVLERVHKAVAKIMNAGDYKLPKN